MNQAEASKVALHTFAAYFADPGGYDPEVAWRPALAAVAGAEHAAALEAFALTSLHGVLAGESAPRLRPLVEAACGDLRDGEGFGPALTALADYLSELDEACYDLKFNLRNYALRAELLPWLEALESWVWAAKRALEVVAASRAGDDISTPLRRLKEPYETARSHHKRSGGSELLAFVELALERHAEAAT